MHLCVTALLALPSVCPNQKGAEQSGGNIRNVKIISWCPEVPSKELRFFFFWQAPLSTSHHSFQINSACVCVMCWCGRALTPVHRRYFEVSNRPPCMPPPTFSGRLGSEHRTHSSHAEAGGEGQTPVSPVVSWGMEWTDVGKRAWELWEKSEERESEKEERAHNNYWKRRDEGKEGGRFPGRAEREVPHRLGTRAEAVGVPEWFKSPGRNPAGGGSDQRKSYDVQDSLRVKQRRMGWELVLDTVGETGRPFMPLIYYHYICVTEPLCWQSFKNPRHDTVFKGLTQILQDFY